jgi:hypothetical protein
LLEHKIDIPATLYIRTVKPRVVTTSSEKVDLYCRWGKLTISCSLSDMLRQHYNYQTPETSTREMTRPSPLDELTTEEREKMNELREMVTGWDLGPEEKQFCTDLTLYRYLYGLSWDMELASKQLKDTVEWRKTYRPQDIRLEELEPVARTGWMFHKFHDKEGRPILYIVVEKDETSADEHLDLKFRHIAYVLENCFQDMEENGYSVTWIVDFKNASVSIDLVKKMKAAMGNIGMFCLHLLLTLLYKGYYYPENLYRIFVLNVGWIVNVMFAFGRTFMTKRMDYFLAF